jgi:hypothetical protein
VLRYIDRSLKKAYAPIANVPEATIKSILESDSMKCFKVDYEAFEPLYLNVDVKPRSINFRLPPCSRIIQLQHSSWNVGKRGCDTTTKLIVRSHYA